MGNARRRGVLGAGLGAALALANGAAAQADVITVDNLLDPDAGAGTSLRDALTAANADVDTDTIRFAAGLSGTLTMATGINDHFTVTRPTRIEGPGKAKLTIDAGDAHQGFVLDQVTAGQEVSLFGLTITRGRADGSGAPDTGTGGGIRDLDGSLSLTDVRLLDNDATDTGGAIDPEQLTLIRTEVTGNTATVAGGGIYTTDPIEIRDSVFSGNSSPQSAALYTTNGPIEIVDSSFHQNTGNEAIQFGAGGEIVGTTISGTIGGPGLQALGVTSVKRSTITSNSDGGAAFTQAFTLEDSTIAGNGGIGVTHGSASQSGLIANSIVAGSATADLQTTGANPIELAFSLVRNPGTAMTTGVLGSNLIGVDPALGPPAANGGPTPTMLPSPASPAVDKGSSSAGVDQRGLPRLFDVPSLANAASPGGDGSDIGAVELTPAEATPPAPVTSQSVASPALSTPPASVRCKKGRQLKKGKCVKKRKKK